MNSKESLRALVGVIQEKIEELGSNNPSDEIEKLIKSKLEPFLEKQGYVSKEKYEGVLKILESLEKRLEKMAKSSSFSIGFTSILTLLCFLIGNLNDGAEFIYMQF